MRATDRCSAKPISGSSYNSRTSRVSSGQSASRVAATSASTAAALADPASTPAAEPTPSPTAPEPATPAPEPHRIVAEVAETTVAKLDETLESAPTSLPATALKQPPIQDEGRARLAMPRDSF